MLWPNKAPAARSRHLGLMLESVTSRTMRRTHHRRHRHLPLLSLFLVSYQNHHVTSRSRGRVRAISVVARIAMSFNILVGDQSRSLEGGRIQGVTGSSSSGMSSCDGVEETSKGSFLKLESIKGLKSGSKIENGDARLSYRVKSPTFPSHSGRKPGRRQSIRAASVPTTPHVGGTRVRLDGGAPGTSPCLNPRRRSTEQTAFEFRIGPWTLTILMARVSRQCRAFKSLRLKFSGRELIQSVVYTV